MHPKLKIGLALNSGAARGWAYIGNIQQLRQLGVAPGMVCGTFIDALVGASYTAGKMERYVISPSTAFTGFVHQHRSWITNLFCK